MITVDASFLVTCVARAVSYEWTDELSVDARPSAVKLIDSILNHPHFDAVASLTLLTFHSALSWYDSTLLVKLLNVPHFDTRQLRSPTANDCRLEQGSLISYTLRQPRFELAVFEKLVKFAELRDEVRLTCL